MLHRGNTPILVPQKRPLQLVEQRLNGLVFEKTIDLLVLVQLQSAIGKLLAEMHADSHEDLRLNEQLLCHGKLVANNAYMEGAREDHQHRFKA